MRYRLFVILIMFSLLGCKDNIDNKSKRNENWAWWTDAKTGKSSWIPVADENQSVRDGRYTRFYFNGNINETGRLVNGRKVDTTFFYDIRGHLQAYNIPQQDSSKEYFIYNGPIKTFYPNGHPMGIGIVKNHTWGDKWIGYFYNGDIQFTQNLKNDTGWIAKYYHGGKLKDSDYYEGGRSFIVKKWYENGHLELSADFKNGNYNGLQKEYYPSGQLKEMGILINGSANGKVTQWYEDGKLQGIGYKKDGLYEGPVTIYYEDGKIKATTTIKHGKADGEIKQYDETGKIISDVVVKDGVKIEDKMTTPSTH